MDGFTMATGYGAITLVCLLLGVAVGFLLRHMALAAVFEVRLYRSGIAHRKRDILRLYWYALTFYADVVRSDGRSAWFPGREWKD